MRWPAGRNGLAGAVAALARTRLARGGGKRVGVRRQRDQIQVFPSVERQFDDALVLDYGSDRCVFRLQQIGLRGNFDGLGNLADLQRDIQANGLLHLHLDVVARGRFEAGMFGLEIVETRRNGRECVIPRAGGFSGAHTIRIDIRKCQRCAGNTGSAGIADTTRNFAQRLT